MLKTGVILAERYRLDDPIAAGGVGQVWRATDLVLQRRVAVKLLRPEYADHPETLSRFQAEARHAGSLAHPAIAQVYDYGDNPHEGPPYLVMELVDGPSLADVLATEPVTSPYALEVLAKAASGLAAAHEAGVVHRDIKPGNILLGRDGQVKITDFGIAFALGSAPVTDPGLVMGTTQYLAPERIAGGSGTPAADLYSLGIVMHECLTGVPPFEGTPAEVMAGHLYVPLPPLPPGTPAEVQDLISRLTAKDPEQRLSDAGELAALARRVRSAITGEPMPRQRQAPGLPAVIGDPDSSGFPAVSGSFPGGPLASGPMPGGPLPGGPPSGGTDYAVIGDPGPSVTYGPGATSHPSGPSAPSGPSDPMRASEPFPASAPAASYLPALRNEYGLAPADRGFGTPPWGDERSPGPGSPIVGVPLPGPMPRSATALALRETTVDRAFSGLGTHAIRGILVDTDPFAPADATGTVQPRPTGRHSAPPPDRRRGRRRAVIGLGVFVLVSGAGLGGAYASGMLRPSPAASHSSFYPPLSEVQPNATAPSPSPSAAAGKNGGKHAKPSASKDAKANSAASAAPAAPAPASQPPAAGGGSGSGSGAPNPAPHHQTPPQNCLLGVLCP